MKKLILSLILLPHALTLPMQTAPALSVRVEYQQSDSEDGVATARLYYKTEDNSGRRVKKEIPQVTLAELIEEKRRPNLAMMTSIAKRWKWYTLFQAVSYAMIGAVYAKNYIDDDQVVAFKKRPNVKQLLAKMPKHSGVRAVLFAGPVLGMAAFPFLYFMQLFDVASLEEDFPWELVEKEFAVFRRKTFSHSVRIGNTVIDYYNYSDPLGYMRYEDVQEQFKPVDSARHCLKVSTVAAGIGVTGLLMAAAKKPFC